MENKKWNVSDIPDLEGKNALVTGANSGLGFYTTRALARKNATVIMAIRNPEKGEIAMKKIVDEVPDAKLVVYELDLASLDSIERFAKRIVKDFQKLDLLINNAGLMAIPYYKTSDGFEMQFGVNHLGHFALTGRLLDLLLKSDGARIVNVSSAAHRMGRIRFEDINWEKSYQKWRAYGMSKLANLLFTDEFVRRLDGKSDRLTVVSAHPGYADTELQTKGAAMKGSRLSVRFFRFANMLAAQSGEMGALPSLYAATAKEVKQAGFYGPDGFLRMKGYPAPDRPKQDLMDKDVAKKLWDISEELTGIRYDFSKS